MSSPIMDAVRSLSVGAIATPVGSTRRREREQNRHQHESCNEPGLMRSPFTPGGISADRHVSTRATHTSILRRSRRRLDCACRPTAHEQPHDEDTAERRHKAVDVHGRLPAKVPVLDDVRRRRRCRRRARRALVDPASATAANSPPGIPVALGFRGPERVTAAASRIRRTAAVARDGPDPKRASSSRGQPDGCVRQPSRVCLREGQGVLVGL